MGGIIIMSPLEYIASYPDLPTFFTDGKIYKARNMNVKVHGFQEVNCNIHVVCVSKLYTVTQRRHCHQLFILLAYLLLKQTHIKEKETKCNGCMHCATLLLLSDLPISACSIYTFIHLRAIELFHHKSEK